MTTSFIPQGYKLPTSNTNYMKIQDGDNKLRILSDTPFMFYKYFSTRTDKPVLLKELPKEIPDDIKPNSFTGAKEIAEMWALVVLDYADSKVKILDFSQNTIKSALFELAQNEDYGNPTEYDIRITKSKEKKGTKDQVKYTVMPLLKSNTISEEIREIASKIDLTEMAVHGGNPFKNSKVESLSTEIVDEIEAKSYEDTGVNNSSGVIYPAEDINPESIPF